MSNQFGAYFFFDLLPTKEREAPEPVPEDPATDLELSFDGLAPLSRALQELPYTEIESVTYSRSKHRRWKSGAGAAIALGVFAVPIFFMKGKKHWLTFEATNPDHHIGLRLDKKNYQAVVSAVEQRGMTVEKIVED